MISVVLACHNGTKYIEKQLLSIAAQTLVPDEVIICDDCSTDGTVQLCKEFIEQRGLKGWKVYENEKNLGFCLNFFSAIEKATGDIIFLCDQDDIWLPEKCEKMVAAMQANPDILSLACRYDIIDGEDNPLPRNSVRFAEFDESKEFCEITAESLVGCSYVSMCFSSKIKENLKPLELKDLLAHDWLINFVAALQSRACFLNHVLTKYRSHGNNASLSAKRSIKRRIDGLEQSVVAHEYLLGLNLPNMTEKLKKSIQKQIRFEKLRLKLLCEHNILCWFKLAFYLLRYTRCYKRALSGLRVWLGDLAYITKY